MIIQLLAVVAAAGDHAALHPQDTDLYISAPDLQGALTATESVGLPRLVRDPAVTKLLGEEVELSSLPSLAADALELPQDALDLLWESAAAASLSVAGLDEFEAAPTLLFDAPDELIAILAEHELMAVLEFSSEERATGLMTMASAATSQLVTVGEEVHQTAAGALKVTDFEVDPGDSQTSLWTAQWGSYVAVGLGKTGAPGLVARLSGGPSLEGAENWSRGAGAMKEEGGIPYLVYHHNLIGDPWYGLSARDAGLPAPDLSLPFIELLFSGVLPFGASEKHGSCRIVDGEYVFETMDLGAKESAAPMPLSDDFLKFVNPEAIGVWATRMDPAAVASNGHELISAMIEIPADVIATEMQYTVGASLEDLLAPLAGGVAFYMLPISGATIPRFHAVVELEDSAKYIETWTTFAGFLKNQGAEFVEVEDRPYRKVPVFSLKQVGDESAAMDAGGPFGSLGSMGMMNPAFTVAILPDRAVFGISSSYVKREVRRLLKEEELTEAHPLAANGPPCPPGVSYFGHLNWPELLGGIYDTLTAFLPLLADSGAMPFDVDELPETATVTQYFSPTFVWSRPGDTGTYTLKRSPVGFETGVGLSGLVAGAAFSMQAGGLGGGGGGPRSLDAEDPIDPSTPVVDAEQPVAEPPADLIQREDTRASLQQVKLGLVIYKSDKGSFPATLAELLAPTPTYPKGFLNADSLPTDGWGKALHYLVEPGGVAYRLWSAGPDGSNDNGEGDDIPAP